MVFIGIEDVTHTRGHTEVYWTLISYFSQEWTLNWVADSLLVTCSRPLAVNCVDSAMVNLLVNINVSFIHVLLKQLFNNTSSKIYPAKI